MLVRIPETGYGRYERGIQGRGIWDGYNDISRCIVGAVIMTGIRGCGSYCRVIPGTTSSSVGTPLELREAVRRTTSYSTSSATRYPLVPFSYCQGNAAASCRPGSAPGKKREGEASVSGVPRKSEWLWLIR